MTPAPVADLVPRETKPRLREFLDRLRHWNRRINLLARAEIEGDLWTRHILDSAQLMPLAPSHAQSWLDLGSGAGFPGLVCAAIAAAEGRQTRFTLVEADARKAAFLREAARCLEVDVRIVNERIDNTRQDPQDVISARALAPLDRLLAHACPFTHAGSRLLFPKGRQAESELTLARRAWHIRVVWVPSRTDPEGTVFQISEVRRRS